MKTIILHLRSTFALCCGIVIAIFGAYLAVHTPVHTGISAGVWEAFAFGIHSVGLLPLISRIDPIVRALTNEPVTLEMRKSGTLTVVGSSDTQCNEIGQSEYAYNLRIDVDASELNNDGWIVDVRCIDKWMQHIPVGSCEQLALTVANMVADRLYSERHVVCRRVWIELTGATGALLSATLEANALQTFLRSKLAKRRKTSRQPS